jgi:putative transposase
VGLPFAITPVDDLELGCLRFVFLLVVRPPAWLRLSRRSASWKEAEILLLRHQIAVLPRQSTARPRLSWADRALFAALLSVISRSHHSRLHLIVTPGTILGWHRDLVRRRWAAKSARDKPGRPPTRRNTVRLVLRMAAPLEPLPPAVTDLEAFRTRRHDRITGVIHEYQQAA